VVPRLTYTVTPPKPTGQTHPPTARLSAPIILAAAYAEARRLTPRDHYLLQLLITHRILTSDHIAAIAFDTPRRARRRLLILTQRGVLARFRHPIATGSQTWRYTPGILGETIHAATTGQPIPRPAKINERITRLTHSPELDHRIGVNGFFTSLLAHARHNPHVELVEWWSAHRTAATTSAYVHPDGYGLWREHPHPNHPSPSTPIEVGFFLEYDRGNEQQSRLTNKIERYAAMTRAGINKPILFAFTSSHRETNFHHHTHRNTTWQQTYLQIATTALDTHPIYPPRHNPAQPIWLPLGRTSRPRQSLIALATTQRPQLDAPAGVIRIP
jgi:hypothetical protein